MLIRSFIRNKIKSVRYINNISAAVAIEPNKPFNIEKLQLSEPKSDEILVKISATGICHTDLAVRDLGLASFPIVLGHEGSGIIEDVGSNVNGFKKGDAVLLTYSACGTCKNCHIGKPSYCDSHGSLNFAGTRLDGSHTHNRINEDTPIYGAFFQQSSFATYALARQQNVLNVNKYVENGLSLSNMAPLGCGIQTGAGAVMNTFRAQAGQSIAIFGCGAVGLSAIMAAKVVGCTNIIAVDIQDSRLSLAHELGATHSINPTNVEDVSEWIKENSTMNGVDYAIDTSGNPKVIRQGFQALRPMGTCGIIGGSPPGTDVAVDLLDMLTQGKSLRGIIQGDSVPSTFLPTLLNLHQQGKFPFDKLLTKYNGGLNDINQAVDDVKAGNVIKPVLVLDN